MRELAEKRLPQLAEATAQAYGATARVNYMRGYPVMVNTGAETDYAVQAARAVAGDCATAPLVMGGEDFAYMLEERPGAYILVGNGDSADVHHPEYNFNDDAIPAGCSYWAELVAQRLPLAG
jgi:hippurate hydrolase